MAVILLCCFQGLYAQENRMEFYVHFVVNSSVLDTTFRDNAANLKKAIDYINDLNSSEEFQLAEIRISGSSSLEGTFLYNANLSQARCSTVERYIRKMAAIPDNITICSSGQMLWDRFITFVEKSDMRHTSRIVKIVNDNPEFTYNSDGDLIDSRKKRLMDFNCGRDWKYMYEHIFPYLRCARIVIIATDRNGAVPLLPVVPGKGKGDNENARHTEPPIHRQQHYPDSTKITTQPLDSLLTQYSDSISVQREDSLLAQKTDSIAAKKKTPEKRDSIAENDSIRPFYMNLRTNMLYDAALVPNLGIEFYLGKNFSIGGNVMYSWWDNAPKAIFWRIYGGDMVVRYWFGKKAKEKPLTGHHAGIYGQIFTYDMELGNTGYLGGKPGGNIWDVTNYAVGLEYGYSLPVARRLNIDFTIGIGYWGGKYYVYRPMDGHYVWQATKMRNWFGPTNAEITLVWQLGHGNVNPKKQKKEEEENETE